MLVRFCDAFKCVVVKAMWFTAVISVLEGMDFDELTLMLDLDYCGCRQ